MKKSFLSEIKRLDTPARKSVILPSNYSDAELGDYDRIPTYEERLEYVNQTVAGKLALELDNSENNFNNNHLWRLYYDLYGSDDWEDVSAIEDELAFCLATLERDNVLSFEVRKHTTITDDDDFLETLEKAQMDYRKKIISTCYENGKFEAENWRIQVRHL